MPRAPVLYTVTFDVLFMMLDGGSLGSADIQCLHGLVSSMFCTNWDIFPISFVGIKGVWGYWHCRSSYCDWLTILEQQ